jgi:predicted hydrolase (HD superfamily)
LAYSEGLEVVNGEGVAEQVKESILKHAAVAVTGRENVSLTEAIAS